MATRLAISWLALLLVESFSYVSATTLQEICKGSYNETYCVKLLQPAATPDTNFKSTTWCKFVITRAATRAMAASDFMEKHADEATPTVAANMKKCIVNMQQSAILLKEATSEYGNSDVSGKLQQVLTSQKACSDSISGNAQGMLAAKAEVDEAYAATNIAKYLI